MIRTNRHSLVLIQLSIIAFIWFLLLAVPVIFGNFSGDINWNHILKIWKEYAYIFGLFLINRFILLPNLFFKGRRVIYFITLAGFILLLFGSMYLRTDTKTNHPLPRPDRGRHPVEMHRPPPHPAPREAIPPYANLLILSILILGFDTGLNISIKWVLSEQKRIQLEKENTENKLAFLHNQVSPHFFMNTLNNIHALVDINTEEAKEAIIKLSQMMDYMLYESQTSTIKLQQEMDFIKSYVDLMKLRFTKHVDIVLDIPAILPTIKIPPLLTISFIENAFKHGISYEKPSFVHIRFMANDSHLSFVVKNSWAIFLKKRMSLRFKIMNTFFL